MSSPQPTQFSRSAGWLPQILKDRQACIPLVGIGIDLPLGEIYFDLPA